MLNTTQQQPIPMPTSHGMSIDDYYRGMMGQYVPEAQLHGAQQVQALRQGEQGEEFAQQQGYPNLAALTLTEHARERQAQEGLRAEMYGGRLESEQGNLAEQLGRQEPYHPEYGPAIHQLYQHILSNHGITMQQPQVGQQGASPAQLALQRIKGL